MTRISAQFPYESHYMDIYGSKMHYIEQGGGDPVLFLHGMPASSYIWRNVIPWVSPLGRAIAPDLIGMGKSDKPDIQYSIFDHIKYIEKFIEVMNLKRITLVMHGWGSLIGLHYAMNHEKNCKGLVFYEPYLRINTDEVSLPLQEQISDIQKESNNHDLIMNSSYFIDKILPQTTMRSLTAEELLHYREPFTEKGSGKPLRQYLNELPNGDQSLQVKELITDYSKKLMKSKLPKLMLYSVPGFVTTMEDAMWAKENLPNLELIEVGEDFHFAQESNPELMGESISVWLQGIEQQVYSK